MNVFVYKIFAFSLSNKLLKLLLNHIIVLNNVFGADAASTLLLFKIEPEYWPQLKSFLQFLNMLPENELKDIHDDTKIKKVLESL